MKLVSDRAKMKGSIVALVTPMEADGSVSWAALDALVDWHLEAGTHGIVAVGTTGESPTLHVDEHIGVIEAVVKRVAGKCPVIAGTGANNTAEAIDWTGRASEVGADAALLVTPYYNKPTQEGLFRHYCAIAEAVSIPQILYNVPGRTACDLLPATIAQLARVPNIIGVKESSGDPSRVTTIRDDCGADFLILSGEDAQTLDMMKLGADGTISVTANAAPALMAKFCQRFLDGDVKGSEALDEQLQPLHAAMFVQSSPIPVKWALAEMNRIPPGIRLPLTALSNEYHDAVRGVLASLELI